MEFRNCTPHALNIVREDGSILTLDKPAIPDLIARCEEDRVQIGSENGVALYVVSYGNVYNLPDVEEDVMLIVSMPVRLAMPNRMDLASPGELLRDVAGKPVGCKGLAVNH